MTKPTGSLVFAAAVLMLSPSPSSAQEVADELKEKAVMIEVNFRGGGSTEFGTGVLLCQENERAWMLTANHVFAGKSDEPWKQLRLTQVDNAKISFYRNYAPPIEADSATLRKEFSFYTFKPEDLLLVSIPLTQKLPSTATLSPPPGDADDPNISSTGFWKDRGLTWEQAAGELASSRAGSTKFLYHTGEVHEGFSGGPVFNQLGELIGINIQRVPGDHTPVGDPDLWFGKAQTIDDPDVLSVIDKWVPAACLESAGQMAELAFLVYRDAMRALNTYDWVEAEKLLVQALGQKRQEGGSVHLEGMRYSKYLPLFQLGLAVYKQERYSEAIAAWDRSESQGVIRDDKRYRQLKRLRNRAYAAIRKQQRVSVAQGAPTLEERAKAYDEQRAVERQAEAEAKAAEGETAAEKAAAEEAAEAERVGAEEAAAAAQAAAEKAAAEKEAREKGPTHRVGEVEPCLTLRAAPSNGAARRGCLSPGTEVRQVERRGVWSRVRPPGLLEGWLDGWLNAEYLEALWVEEVGQSYRVVASPCLILRRGPTRASDRLDCFPPGSIVEVRQRQDDWSDVRVDDGREGWMFSDYLRVVAAAEKVTGPHRVAVGPCLILRRRPTRQSERLDCFPPDSVLEVLDGREGWSRVRFDDGREGWMFTDMLESIDETGGT